MHDVVEQERAAGEHISGAALDDGAAGVSARHVLEPAAQRRGDAVLLPSMTASARP
jgi:hypothetical protein